MPYIGEFEEMKQLVKTQHEKIKKYTTDFELDKYEHAVGSMRAAQISLQIFIKDPANDLHDRKYAETIYEWLGSLEATIDELLEISSDKTFFILNALKKYSLSPTLYDSNTILNYIYAIDSLRSQIQNYAMKNPNIA